MDESASFAGPSASALPVPSLAPDAAAFLPLSSASSSNPLPPPSLGLADALQGVLQPDDGDLDAEGEPDLPAGEAEDDLELPQPPPELLAGLQPHLGQQALVHGHDKLVVTNSRIQQQHQPQELQGASAAVDSTDAGAVAGPSSGYSQQDATTGPPGQIDERTMPDRQEYDAAVDAYVAALHPIKRNKALMSSHLHNMVLQILQKPEDTKQGDPQLRFWVRQRFTLLKATEGDSVLHEEKKVVLRPNLYDTIAVAHEEVKHGGRDKTYAAVKKHWSYVPKEVVTVFVKICPTCNGKRVTVKGKRPKVEKRPPIEMEEGGLPDDIVPSASGMPQPQVTVAQPDVKPPPQKKAKQTKKQAAAAAAPASAAPLPLPPQQHQQPPPPLSPQQQHRHAQLQPPISPLQQHPSPLQQRLSPLQLPLSLPQQQHLAPTHQPQHPHQAYVPPHFSPQQQQPHGLAPPGYPPPTMHSYTPPFLPPGVSSAPLAAPAPYYQQQQGQQQQQQRALYAAYQHPGLPLPSQHPHPHQQQHQPSSLLAPPHQPSLAQHAAAATSPSKKAKKPLKRPRSPSPAPEPRAPRAGRKSAQAAAAGIAALAEQEKLYEDEEYRVRKVDHGVKEGGSSSDESGASDGEREAVGERYADGSEEDAPGEPEDEDVGAGEPGSGALAALASA
ncbi:uncharacterized protein JCM10292_002842 [Rhodotorula paludigena]|uniref:uncharacterized protein n=1 Tax=Rhodotorula paludigena TaxID=86838 RepID=UPI00317E81FC